MIKHKAHKHRLYPTEAQKVSLSKTFGSCRFAWNAILDWRSKEFSLKGVKNTLTTACKKVTALRKEFPFLEETSAVALQQTIRNQEAAFSNFFKKRAKYPTFKKKHANQSFRLIDNAFRLKNNRFFIAKVEEPIKVRWSRPLEGVPSSCTISRNSSGQYFVSFCFETEIDSLPESNNAIGIDLGLTHFAVLSTGEKIKPAKALRRHEARLKRYQKVLSRRQKGGCNRNKARSKVARVHQHIANIRHDFLHKLSTRLIRENQSIALEDLNVSGMAKNHKLSKSISDASWSTFVGFLKYKAEWYGRKIQQVSPWFPSSQLCSCCGFRSGKKPLSVRSWTCEQCNTFHDRDINAAININTAGHAGINDHGASSSEISSSNRSISYGA